MTAKVKIGGVEAIPIKDVPQKDKDGFGYPLGTLWQRVSGPGMLFMHKNGNKGQ